MDDALRQEIIQSDIKPPVFTKLLKHLYLADFDIPLENIHEVNVEAMIKKHYFAFSVEIYKALGQSYPGLCEMYILENRDAFFTIVSTVPLEKETFENLIVSRHLYNSFKETIIKYHGAKLMSYTVAELVCDPNLSITKDVFDAAWDILDVSKKKALMLAHAYILKAKDFETYFAKPGNPYLDFTDRSRRHNVTIPDDVGHRKLVERLQQVGYITSYEHIESDKEFDKKLRKMVTHPMILCRVKADPSKSTSK